jgi:hypothetical protein
MLSWPLHRFNLKFTEDRYGENGEIRSSGAASV